METAADMGHALDIVAHAFMIGVGATAVMDLWATLLRQCCRVQSLDYALLGRWIGHFPRGRFRHENIAQTPPVRHERILGWTAHYAIGIVFAAVLLATVGLDWLKKPTALPALLVSSATLVAPFFVMQPAMGVGIAASKTPRPHVARLRSIVTHTVYGIGLYATAWGWSLLIR